MPSQSLLRKIKTGLKTQPFIRRNLLLRRFNTGRGRERQVGLLQFVCDPGRLSVDVGANIGAYTHELVKLGGPVLAIDPNPALAGDLEAMFKGKATVICAAVSSAPGTITLRIPKTNLGSGHALGTVEEQNTLASVDVDQIEVPKVVLDEMNLGPVGFIKIDVEGHEHEVLMGAKKILERDRPAIMIEAEERHKPGAVESIRDLLAEFGYQGMMLNHGRMSPISNFDLERDQSIDPGDIEKLNSDSYTGRYINNFLFLA